MVLLLGRRLLPVASVRRRHHGAHPGLEQTRLATLLVVRLQAGVKLQEAVVHVGDAKGLNWAEGIKELTRARARPDNWTEPFVYLHRLRLGDLVVDLRHLYVVRPQHGRRLWPLRLDHVADEAHPDLGVGVVVGLVAAEHAGARGRRGRRRRGGAAPVRRGAGRRAADAAGAAAAQRRVRRAGVAPRPVRARARRGAQHRGEHRRRVRRVDVRDHAVVP